MKRLLLLFALSLGTASAQAPDGSMTPSEIESLRDVAYIPVDRVEAYEKILNTREKALAAVLKKRHGPDFAADVHDLIDQFGTIADELNDNLDSYASKHRDLRKILPKLVQATERWSTLLRSPPDDDRYNVVRRVSLDALSETRKIAETMETDQAQYFKDHPDAAKTEKSRLEAPHTPQ